MQHKYTLDKVDATVNSYTEVLKTDIWEKIEQYVLNHPLVNNDDEYYECHTENDDGSMQSAYWDGSHWIVPESEQDMYS